MKYSTKMFKRWRTIENYFGVDAVLEFKEILGKACMKVDELEKSRDSWKAKYLKLKGRKKK